MAAWGETVPVSFAIDNRGGADAGAFTVQLLLSSSETFAPASSQVLQTIAQHGLATGAEFDSPAGFTVTLPAAPAGLPASGPVYLGLRIVPGDPTQDSGVFDKSGVHRGEDWESLTIVTPVLAAGTNQSLAAAQPLSDLNAQVSGSLGPGQVNWYQLTAYADGQLRVWIEPAAGGAQLRVSLLGPDGQLLIQSDGGPSNPLVQSVTPGTYFLTVSGPAGPGSYQLTTTFTPADAPLQGLPVGSSPDATAVSDLNGDGALDLVVANGGSDTVSVLLGNGDGTFQLAQTLAVASDPTAVAVADLNGDGKPDLVVASEGAGTLSVFLGNGDGAFQTQPEQTFKVALFPQAMTLADLDGQGTPDLVFADAGSDSVSVVLGNGDGTFQTQTTFAGTYGIEQTYTVGENPTAVAAADLTGNGLEDLVVANGGSGTVSVLLADGHGGFQAPPRTPWGPTRPPWRSPSSTATARASPIWWWPTAATAR